MGGLPRNIHQLIDSQLARLSLQHQMVLEAASVAGMTFSTAAIAAALGKNQEQVEQTCERVARQGLFLRAEDLIVWPDGTATTRYAFQHALYQETLYERIAPGRRILLHQRIGQRLESGYGDTARAIAAELAVHFEEGREYHRAVQYLQQAGEDATLGSAGSDYSPHQGAGAAQDSV